MNVEGILYVLTVIDCLAYLIMSFFRKMHKKKDHFWMKDIPLNKPLALGYLVVVIWLGYALFRLGALL